MLWRQLKCLKASGAYIMYLPIYIFPLKLTNFGSSILHNYKLAAVASTRCMGHNRGWEEAASVLSGLNVELKTANAALLQTSGSSWEEVLICDCLS